MSEEVSYDVYVRVGVDLLGRDEFGEAVGHFMEREHAVALKRRLEARGETVRVERTSVQSLSEAGKEGWFSDYSRTPEFDLPRDQGPSESVAEGREREERHRIEEVERELEEVHQTLPGGAPEEPERAESRLASGDFQTASERIRWWRRVFGR